MYRHYIKRIIDFTLALIGLICFSSILLGTAIAVRFFLGAPVIFKQFRPGKEGKPFIIFKFRTMKEAYDKNGEPLSDEKRLTAFGKFLRKTSLDELPELWNVLKGEMSFVGPRPLLMDYLPLYTKEQSRRHEIKPGITGWAQVNGRNEMPWDERLNLDVWYVNHQNFLLDLKILFRTILKVLACADVSSKEHATKERFMGTKKAQK